MKKLKTLPYYIFLIIFEELIFSLIIFKTFPINLWLIIIFSVPIAAILSIISNIFKPSLNKFITYIFTLLNIFIFGAQIVYYSMYEAIISFYSILHGGQVTEFMDVIFDMILRNWYGILLFTVPLIVLIILNKKKKIDYERYNLKEVLERICIACVLHVVALIFVNTINTKDIYSNKNLYYNIHVPKITANRFGLITTMRLDLQRFIFGFEDDLAIETSKEIEPQKEQEYNKEDIDFLSLAQTEQDETIKEMHEYFSSEDATNKNEYTGMFEGKNLIVLVAESFSQLAIREDLTPNLYKLYKEGFQFDNFYTPVFPVSTADRRIHYRYFFNS